MCRRDAEGRAQRARGHCQVGWQRNGSLTPCFGEATLGAASLGAPAGVTAAGLSPRHRQRALLVHKVNGDKLGAAHGAL